MEGDRRTSQPKAEIVDTTRQDETPETRTGEALAYGAKTSKEKTGEPPIADKSTKLSNCDLFKK